MVGEVGDVGGGDAGDFGEGFVGEEGLMGGDEDVREVEEEGEFVVDEELAGEVLEENAFFFFVDVEGDACDAAGFECGDEGGGFDEFAAAGIDDEDAFFEAVHGVGVEEEAGVGEEGDVEGDDVASGEEVFCGGVGDLVGGGPCVVW